MRSHAERGNEKSPADLAIGGAVYLCNLSGTWDGKRLRGCGHARPFAPVSDGPH